MRQLILDTETTGLYPERGHRIIEFAALEMIDRRLTGNSLHLYINPECLIDPEASKIHGITDADVRDKPIFKDVVLEIIEFIKDSQLIIHNAKFDLSFMDYQFKLMNLGITADHVDSVIDTLIMARQKFPGGKNSLDALCDRFNIDRANRNYHGALIDCGLLSDVYLALTKEQISLIQDERTTVKNVNHNNFKRINSSDLNLKVVNPSQEELELHQKYLDNLNKSSNGNCLWIKNSSSS